MFLSYYIGVTFILINVFVGKSNCLPKEIIINPRRMREGYGSHCVCVCVSVSVSVSVITLATTYLIYILKTRSLEASYDMF